MHKELSLIDLCYQVHLGVLALEQEHIKSECLMSMLQSISQFAHTLMSSTSDHFGTQRFFSGSTSGLELDQHIQALQLFRPAQWYYLEGFCRQIDAILDGALDPVSVDLLSSKQQQELLRFFMQASLVVDDPPELAEKQDFLVGAIKMSQVALRYAIQSDLNVQSMEKGPNCGLKKEVIQTASEGVSSRLSALNTLFDSIISTLNPIFTRGTFSNIDIDFLRVTLGRFMDQIKIVVRGLYQETIQTPSWNRVYFGELDRAMQIARTRFQKRFNPLSMITNYAQIARSCQLRTAKLSSKIKPKLRVHDDPHQPRLRSSKVIGDWNVTWVCGQSDRPHQEDRVRATVFKAPATLTALTLSDILFDAIEQHVQDLAEETFCGSTLSWTAVWQNTVITANIGDSKAFLVQIAKGGNVTVQELSWSHEPSQPIERRRIEDSGGMVGADNRFQFTQERGLNVSRSIGDKDHQKYGLSSEPDFTIFEVADDVQALVINVSDGFTHVMGPSELASFFQLGFSLPGKEHLADLLRHEAYQRYPTGKKADNISVVVIPVVKNSPYLVLGAVHDGHRGDYVSHQLHKTHRRHVMTAAARRDVLLVPTNLREESMLWPFFQTQLLEQLDQLVDFASEGESLAVYQALRRFRTQMANAIHTKELTESYEQSLQRDVIPLLEHVLRAVRALQPERGTRLIPSSTADFDDALEQLRRRVRISVWRTLLRSVLVLSAALLGLYCGIMLWSLVLQSLSPIASNTLSATFLAGLTTVALGGLGYWFAYRSIYHKPQELRRTAAEGIVDELMASGSREVPVQLASNQSTKHRVVLV